MAKPAGPETSEWTFIRVAIPDRPGGLGILTRCLGACGVDIAATETVGHRDGAAIADLLVHGGDLDRAVRALDDDVRVLGRRVGGELPDPGLAMAAACAAALAEAAPAPILAAALELVAADAGLLGRSVAGALDVLASQGSVPRTARTLAADLDERDSHAVERSAKEGGGSLLAISTGPPPALALVACRGDGLPFIDAEAARLQAFGRIASVLLSPR